MIKKHFKAHKVVLSASGTVFKNIIRDNNTSNPGIYLRGILSYEIESILQFIYLGQATFYQERMNEFLNVGKSLEIKEISQSCTAGSPIQKHSLLSLWLLGYMQHHPGKSRSAMFNKKETTTSIVSENSDA